MTIAELLVQATATRVGVSDAMSVYAAFSQIDNGGKVTRADIDLLTSSSLTSSQARARAIVAAIYGEPCESPTYCSAEQREPEGDYVMLVPTPGDACVTCKWPRSQHGVKP